MEKFIFASLCIIIFVLVFVIIYERYKNRVCIKEIEELETKNKDEKERHSNTIRKMEKYVYYFTSLGVLCSSVPYKCSWNSAEVVILTKNAFIWNGYIYPDPETYNTDHNALVVVNNKNTGEYIFLEFVN